MIRWMLLLAMAITLIPIDSEAGRDRVCKVSTDACYGGQIPPRIGVTIALVEDKAECNAKAAGYFTTTCDVDAHAGPADSLPRTVKAEYLEPDDNTRPEVYYCVADTPSGTTCSTVVAPSNPYAGLNLGEPTVGVIRYDIWHTGNDEQDLLKYSSGTDDWQPRLPFYTRINGSTPSTIPVPPTQFPYLPQSIDFTSDRQSVMDEELKYAASAGLDYFAFLWHGQYGFYQNTTDCEDTQDHGSPPVPMTPLNVTPPVSGPLDPAIHWKNNIPFDRSLQLYLTSNWSDRVNFALVMNWGRFGPNCAFRDPNPDDENNTVLIQTLFEDDEPLSSWFETYLEQWIELAKQKQFQAVLGNRPLIYLLNLHSKDPSSNLYSLAAYFTPTTTPADAATRKQANQRARIGIAKIRARFTEEGLGNPYIVGMFPFHDLSNPHPDEARFLSDTWGLDAISRYTRSMDATCNYGGFPGGNGCANPQTIESLRGSSGSYYSNAAYPGIPYVVEGSPNAPSVYNRWVQFRDLLAAKNKQIIPPMMVGYDFRPRLIPSPYPAPPGNPFVAFNPRLNWSVYTPRVSGDTAPAQIADHLEDVLNWTRDNPQLVEANSVLVYAWNEMTEGGWLVPTLAEGNERLVQIRERICAPVAGFPPESSDACKRLPVGEVDQVGGGTVGGWAYDPDKPMRSTRVDFYAGAPYSSNPLTTGTLIGSARADQTDLTVNANEGIIGKHRFSFTLPKKYYGQQVYAHAIDAVRFAGNPLIPHGALSYSVHATECNDGVDNDTDGSIDTSDAQCATVADRTEAADCNDGIDNDSDGNIDFAGLSKTYPPDPNCGTWGFGYEGDIATSNCSDGVDNDGDGLADTLGAISAPAGAQPDSGCTALSDNSE